LSRLGTARDKTESVYLTVRTSRGAAVGVVTKGVDVETTLGVGVLAAEVVGDGGGRALGVLLEGDGTLDVRVTAEDSNCREMDG
jgi:hypothetical protein